jgi:hypothetical protein
MAVDRSRYVRILVTITHAQRKAIADYAMRSGAPSESAAIRTLIADALARDVAARVQASIGAGIASPQSRPRDPA